MVIITTYNRAYLLGKVIESVICQTYKDWELVVIDDASTDNTADVVKDYQSQDNRIRYIRNPENKGLAFSRNQGIKHSKGDYIAFLDDDDEWLPEKLGKQMALIKNKPPEYGVVYCGGFSVAEAGRVVGRVMPKLRGNICG